MSKDFVFHIDLESILRAKGITHLVMAGISTSGVVLSTLRWAADFDYDITGSFDYSSVIFQKSFHISFVVFCVLFF
jgi:nicotinamidase-related amidase